MHNIENEYKPGVPSYDRKSQRIQALAEADPWQRILELGDELRQDIRLSGKQREDLLGMLTRLDLLSYRNEAVERELSGNQLDAVLWDIEGNGCIQTHVICAVAQLEHASTRSTEEILVGLFNIAHKEGFTRRWNESTLQASIRMTALTEHIGYFEGRLTGDWRVWDMLLIRQIMPGGVPRALQERFNWLEDVVYFGYTVGMHDSERG